MLSIAATVNRSLLKIGGPTKLETQVRDSRLESDSSLCFADLGLDLGLALRDSRLRLKDLRLT